MSEDPWLKEARQVRGIPDPDPVDRAVRGFWHRLSTWKPTMEDVPKVIIVTTIVTCIAGVIFGAYQLRKGETA